MNHKENCASGCDKQTNGCKNCCTGNKCICTSANNCDIGIIGHSKNAANNTHSDNESSATLQSSVARIERQSSYTPKRHSQSTKILQVSALSCDAQQAQSPAELELERETPFCKWNDDLALKHAEDLLLGINGKTQNDKEAFRCLKRLAKNKLNPRALGLLGFCYDFGIGCNQDYEKSLDAYMHAALFDDLLAIARLCELFGVVFNNKSERKKYMNMFDDVFKRSREVENKCRVSDKNPENHKTKNSKEEHEFAQGPLKWLWWAATNCSNAYAQYVVGICFDMGLGTNSNYELAAKWYWRSIRQGCSRAESSLAVLYLYGNGVKKNEKAGHRLLTQAVAKNEGYAMYQLGFCYEEGLGVPQDFGMACKVHLRALGKKVWISAIRMGLLYQMGLGVECDTRYAGQFYHIAAGHYCPLKMFWMGNFYQAGICVPQDDYIAFEWHQRSAIRGLKWAQSSLGDAYKFGRGVQRDLTEAVKWYRRAADQKYGTACVNLARCLENGLGTPIDYQGALEMVERAITLEDEPLKKEVLISWATSLAKQVSCHRIAQSARQKVENDMHSLASSA